MIELTGDPTRDQEIIGFSRRRNFWIGAIDDLTRIRDSSLTNAVSDTRELQFIQELQELLQQIKVAT